MEAAVLLAFLLVPALAMPYWLRRVIAPEEAVIFVRPVVRARVAWLVDLSAVLGATCASVISAAGDPAKRAFSLPSIVIAVAGLLLLRWVGRDGRRLNVYPGFRPWRSMYRNRVAAFLRDSLTPGVVVEMGVIVAIVPTWS